MRAKVGGARKSTLIVKPGKQKKETLAVAELEKADDDLFNDQSPAQKADDIPVLSEKEREANITRVLKAANPQAPHNYSFFNFRDRVFRKDDMVDHVATHFSADGHYLLKGSNEESEQQEFLEGKSSEADMAIKDSAVDEGMPTEMDHATLLRSLRNQFNYCERTCQTFTSSVKERGISTEPPPLISFTTTVTQWEVYDSFLTDAEVRRLLKIPEIDTQSEVEVKREDPLFSEEMAHALKIMERMVTQISQADFYRDYKEWDDTSDALKPEQGDLYPLWRFGSQKTKKKEVTAIAWNPRYLDMFAVGYGSYDFMKQGTGLICCYSLKNTTHPEYIFTTEYGVMCLDWHPQHPALLAIGLYDGTVLVYDVRSRHNKPIYQSTIRTNKHTDPVWQVKWQVEDATKNLSFISISSDGRVTCWVLMKNKLEAEELLKLKLVTGQKDGEDEEVAMGGLAGGMCFDFNPFIDYLFVVGTEEGKIHKCSKAYSGQYLETYEGHTLAVYSVKWNYYHPKVFLSASADWNIKLWDHTVRAALLNFDMGLAVNDIAWAPYSSTIFLAVTADTKCNIFALHIEKHGPLNERKSAKNTKLNHVAFNPEQPIVLLGDDHGAVNSMKLSPNMRKKVPPEAEDGKTPEKRHFDSEVQKIEEFLNSIDRTVY